MIVRLNPGFYREGGKRRRKVRYGDHGGLCVFLVGERDDFFGKKGGSMFLNLWEIHPGRGRYGMIEMGLSDNLVEVNPSGLCFLILLTPGRREALQVGVITFLKPSLSAVSFVTFVNSLVVFVRNPENYGMREFSLFSNIPQKPIIPNITTKPMMDAVRS